MLRIIVACAGLAVLAACASPTPYAPAAAPGGYGYEHTQIERDRFRVSFSGNSLTDRETVETYLLYRAAELTLEQGYGHFHVVRQDTDRDTRIYRDSPYYGPWHHPGFYAHYRYYHPRYGWYGWHDPFWDNRPYREVTRYHVSAEIVMSPGRSAQRDDSFDAREVVANLGPHIRWPAPDGS